MSYEVNFGNLTVTRSRPVAKKDRRFRLVVLGDFSARANRGEVAVGEDLARRKPLKVDCDNLDEIIERLGIRLDLALGGDEAASVSLEISSMDDLHPDQLFEKLEVFSELSALRKRLKTTSTFAKAAKEVQSWIGDVPEAAAPVRAKARGTTLSVESTLSDFARLSGQEARESATETPVDELLKRIVAPHVVPVKDPRQDAMVAAVDQALSSAMRSVLHHPDFQTTEALLRSVDFLVRRLETDEHLQIVLIDVTAEEFAADLSQADALENSGLYKLLVEQPSLDAHQGPFAAIVANYVFERTPPHAELLGRMARIAAEIPAPFIGAIGADIIDQKPGDLHPLIQEAWAALKEMKEASTIGLTVPRFLLRLPYGEKTDPIDSFDFEEFTPQSGLRGMLFGNSAVFAGFLLAATFARDGQKMRAGSVMQINEMPLYYYTDSDGDQIALPCTERLLTSRTASSIAEQGFMPVLAIKGSPEIRLGGFASVTGHDLVGFWSPFPVEAPPEPPVAEADPAAEAASEEESTASESDGATEEFSDGSGGEAESEPAALEESEPIASEGEAEPAVDSEAPAEDADLAALLSDLGSETAAADTSASPDAMDADLEKLLGDLG